MVDADVSSEQQSATNALLKYAYGLDNADEIELGSSFTKDAILDLTRFASLGMNFPATEGRDAVVDECMKSVGKSLDTSHTLTNFRVLLNEDKSEANVLCYAEAQHFRKGQGLIAGLKDYYLVKSKYNALVVLINGEWRIKRLLIEPIWSQGTAIVFDN